MKVVFTRLKNKEYRIIKDLAKERKLSVSEILRIFTYDYFLSENKCILEKNLLSHDEFYDDDNLRGIGFRVEDKLYRKIEEQAKKFNLSKYDLLREIIFLELEKESS